jgi:hypothetical protein
MLSDRMCLLNLKRHKTMILAKKKTSQAAPNQGKNHW